MRIPISDEEETELREMVERDYSHLPSKNKRRHVYELARMKLYLEKKTVINNFDVKQIQALKWALQHIKTAHISE